MTKQQLLDIGSLIGPFKIEKSVPKHGGMSELYIAHLCDTPSRKVALKLNRIGEKDAENPRNVFQDLLRREADYLQKLRHPGVVRIYPIAFDPNAKVVYAARAKVAGTNLWYYVMEYLPAGNLENHLATIRQLPVEWAVEFFYQLLVTLQFMNRQGFAHCDLKPENIMLREVPSPNRTPQPVLIDFGSVEKVGKYVQTPCATPAYSPPEVLLAMQRTDLAPEELRLRPEKIDIWSLGAIFYALLTGKPMFGQRSRTEVTSSVISGQIARIRNHRTELHESLDTLLEAMMEKDPDDRADLDDVISAIEEMISSVRPPRLPVGY